MDVNMLPCRPGGHRYDLNGWAPGRGGAVCPTQGGLAKGIQNRVTSTDCAAGQGTTSARGTGTFSESREGAVCSPSPAPQTRQAS